MSPSLQRLQAVELEIFKELQRVCEKHSLRYYLLAGSALGAVRHQGFIPWDDDIDVGLPRPDYEQFSDYCRTELDERFFWQTYHTEPSYTAIFGKLRMNGTRYIEQATARLPIHHGIKIDVFPLDGIPRNARARALHRMALRACMVKIGSRLERSQRTTFRDRIARLIPRRMAIALCEKMTVRYPFDDSEIVVNMGGAWGYERESAARSWFAGGETLPFEDVRARVPKLWHEYLTHMYGDYMRLPPEDQRVNDRHPVSSIDFAADDEAE